MRVHVCVHVCANARAKETAGVTGEPGDAVLTQKQGLYDSF